MVLVTACNGVGLSAHQIDLGDQLHERWQYVNPSRLPQPKKPEDVTHRARSGPAPMPRTLTYASTPHQAAGRVGGEVGISTTLYQIRYLHGHLSKTPTHCLPGCVSPPLGLTLDILFRIPYHKTVKHRTASPPKPTWIDKVWPSQAKPSTSPTSTPSSPIGTVASTRNMTPSRPLLTRSSKGY